MSCLHESLHSASPVHDRVPCFRDFNFFTKSAFFGAYFRHETGVSQRVMSKNRGHGCGVPQSLGKIHMTRTLGKRLNTDKNTRQKKNAVPEEKKGKKEQPCE